MWLHGALMVTCILAKLQSGDNHAINAAAPTCHIEQPKSFNGEMGTGMKNKQKPLHLILQFTFH